MQAFDPFLAVALSSCVSQRLTLGCLSTQSLCVTPWLLLLMKLEVAMGLSLTQGSNLRRVHFIFYPSLAYRKLWKFPLVDLPSMLLQFTDKSILEPQPQIQAVVVL